MYALSCPTQGGATLDRYLYSFELYGGVKQEFNKRSLFAGTMIVIHSERTAFVERKTGNIKKNLGKLSEVTPLDSRV